MASPLSREIFIGEKYSSKPVFGRNAFVAAVRCARREGMAKRDDAALKLLRWELEGHGKVVMEAMLRPPDKSLAEAVDLIEQEVPALSASDRSTNDPLGEMPAPVVPSRPRSPPELDALSQEFQTFRHLLHPKEAKEVEAALKELVRSQDRAAMTSLRRRLRALSLQAAFWSELAAGHKESNAIALVILRKGREVLAKASETAYRDEHEVAEMIRRESERRAKGTYVLDLPVGGLVVMTGEGASIAALFRRAPGKDVVQVLVKTVEAIEENKAAATKTFGNEKLAGKYAEALLKLLQKTSPSPRPGDLKAAVLP